MLVCLIAIGLLGGSLRWRSRRPNRLAPVSLIAPFEYTALLVAAVFGYAIWGQVPDRFVGWERPSSPPAASISAVARRCARR